MGGLFGGGNHPTDSGGFGGEGSNPSSAVPSENINPVTGDVGPSQSQQPKDVNPNTIEGGKPAAPQVKPPDFASVPDTSAADTKKANVTRDLARQHQEGLGLSGSYRRSTLLTGLLGLSDANLNSARKTLLGS